MVNTAQAQKQKLDIDKIIIALVDHDGQLQFFKKIKVLTTKLSHKKNSENKNVQEILMPSSSALPAKKNGAKSPCDNCGLACHNKKSSYFLLPTNE